jgi:hypothetical protein
MLPYVLTCPLNPSNWYISAVYRDHLSCDISQACLRFVTDFFSRSDRKLLLAIRFWRQLSCLLCSLSSWMLPPGAILDCFSSVCYSSLHSFRSCMLSGWDGLPPPVPVFAVHVMLTGKRMLVCQMPAGARIQSCCRLSIDRT